MSTTGSVLVRATVRSLCRILFGGVCVCAQVNFSKPLRAASFTYRFVGSWMTSSQQNTKKLPITA